MRIALLPSVLLAALCLGGPLAAADREVLVEEVRIEGCRSVHPDRIRFLATVRPGRAYDSQQELPLALADDVRAIERMGPFTSTTSRLVYGADPSKVTVVFTVTELPYVAAISWRGLDDAGWSADSDLEKRMETKVGGYANQLIVENDLKMVQRYFRDKGHSGVTARVERREVAGGVELVFVVDLPRAVDVALVAYRGLPDGMRRRHLDDILERTQINRPGRPWQPELLPLDQGDVPRALQDEGWLDARLAGVEIEHTDFVRPFEDRRRGGPAFVPDGAYDDRVHIVYALDAGERYRLGSVSFVGNTVASSEDLRAAFTMAEGDWFRRADVSKAVERARRVIANRGYARCRFATDRNIDFATRTINLVIQVDEGRQYRVGRVDIRGNEMTRDSVVRRAVQLAPGDLWSDDAKDESKRQILRSGLFKDEPRRPFAFNPSFPADRPDEADIEIDLDEQRSGSLQLQVGYNSSTGLFGQFGYSERNFDLAGALSDPFGRWRGGGQILDLNLNLGQQRSSINLGWTEPALGDGPWSLSTSLVYSDSTQRDWDEIRTAGSATLGRAFFKSDLRLGLTYSYADIKISSVQDDAPDDAVEGTRFLNSLGLSASYDRLDNGRLPTRGVLLAVSDTTTGVLLPATDPLNELAIKADGFLPLLENDDGGVTFLRLGAHWRQVFALDGSGQAPFYERYLGGGPAPRHRGFTDNDLGPKAINQNGFEARVGGDRDFLTTLELSYPLQGSNDGIRSIAFIDVGNVWGKGERVAAADLRTAWGIGLRFPMQFPISLDFAWLLDPRDGEAATQVHFGLGQVRF